MKIPLINFKQFRRKLLSLTLAIILWFFVTENSVLIDQKTVDVEYRGLSDNVIMVESLQKISYTISKNPYYPDNIKINVKPYVEIKDSSPGWHTFPVKMDLSAPLPTYANIHLSVNSARVLLDNKSAKNVLLKPDIEVSNPSDFSVTNIRVTPSITQITGPESVLENIKNIFLETVNVSRAGEFKMDVNTLSPATSVSITDKKVSLQFSIYSNYITKVITLPIAIKNLVPGLSIESMSVREVPLRLKGLKSQFDAIEANPGSILFLDLLEIDSKGVYPKVPIHLALPDGMTLLNSRSIANNVDISINSINLDEENDTKKESIEETMSKEKTSPEPKNDDMPFLLETPYPDLSEEKNTKETDKITSNTTSSASNKSEEDSVEKHKELDDNTEGGN